MLVKKILVKKILADHPLWKLWGEILILGGKLDDLVIHIVMILVWEFFP